MRRLMSCSASAPWFHAQRMAPWVMVPVKPVTSAGGPLGATRGVSGVLASVTTALL